MSIKTFKPFISRKDMDSVLTTLVSEEIGSGKVNREFSSAAADYLGVESGFVLKEYERGIETVFKALDFAEGECVALSPLSSFYYKKVLDSLDIESVIIDVEPDTGIIKLDKLNTASETVKAVLIDSPFGVAADYLDLDEEITVIEDISASAGGGYEDVKNGSKADYVIMNMDPERIITAGCGVFIAAAGKKGREKLKRAASELGRDKFLPDINCALALSLLSTVDKYIGIRNEIAENYKSALMKTQHKTVIHREESTPVYPFFPVIAGSSTKEIIKYAAKKKIEILNSFEDSIIAKYEITDCPEAAGLRLRCLIFPLYPNLGKKNIEHIVKVITTLP